MNFGTIRSRLSATVAATAIVAGAGALLLAASPARALSVYDGSQYGNNLEINLTTTLSYTGAWRVNSPSAVLKPGQDGDANFQHGLVTNLFSAVPVLDLRDGDYGAHVSGQFYINTTYLGTNQNDLQPWSGAVFTAKQTDFTSGTRNVDGQNAQLLDAFVFGQHTFANGQSLQVKIGRSVLFWGQSLYFPSDGISGGQAPINIISAQNLINPEAQQVFMPVGQAIVTYQPVSGTTIQGYYQFEWEHDFFQGEGGYFGTNNALDKGAGYLSLANIPLLGTVGVTRIKDADVEHQNGQFGLSLQQEVGAWDLGVFGERFDAKSPTLGLAPYSPSPIGVPVPGANPAALARTVGYYQVQYPRDIWLEGASFSTNLGPANVAGEFSVRQHQPLLTSVDAVGFFVVPGHDTNGNPNYPVGDTWDAQLSTLYVTPAVPLDPGGVTISGEIILNHLIKVTRNRALLRTNGQATAGAFDIGFTPTYNDVLPNLQVTVPVSITYDYLGRSDVDATLYHGTGVFDAGVTATYQVNWIASLSYQDYLGKPDTVYNALADRGYVSLNLQHTF